MKYFALRLTPEELDALQMVLAAAMEAEADLHIPQLLELAAKTANPFGYDDSDSKNPWDAEEYPTPPGPPVMITAG